jgi:amidohydrolase
VAEIMERLGYRVRKNVGRTGVVAEFGSGKPLFAIRADMDALPILETNRVPYASQNTGVMHACGHDSHMAMALGAAVLLSGQKSPGTVRFLFQPSEEIADSEGVSGAPRMIQDGAMEGVELIIALHVEPTAPVGSIRIKSGPASGGVDSWFGEIIGKGAHGAHPHQSVDPFYLMTQVIPALNAIVSRRIDPFDPAVVSVGSVHGGFTENVIPEKVRITGTLRYTKKSVQEQIHAEIKSAFEIARTLGGDYELKIEIGSSPLFNSPQACDLIASAATELLGKENLLPWKDELGAEDFGSFLEHAPGAMFALGTMSEKFQCQLHNPDFDLDEACLPIGAAVLAKTALKFFQNNNS